ncbi:MAG: hypothetical protein CL916_09440 [Deltaproteobacteria bacterium]|nr:hypothetical protein [Deltaproteobacteria bacterium]
MYLLFFFACDQPSIQERWEKEPLELVAQSAELESFEQQLLFRWIRDQRSEMLHDFCTLSHVEEVEYQCSLFENRPHLSDIKKRSSDSILHGYKADEETRTIKERFLLVQEQTSTKEIAKICNGLDDMVMRSECYFVAADSFHSRRGTKAFQDMIQLCFASGPFVDYCLSHIPQRIMLPSFQQEKQWKRWEERFFWMKTHSNQDIQLFGDRLMHQLGFRVVQEMSELCWDSIHEGTLLEPIFKDALVFFRFAEQGEKRRFFEAIEQWEEMFYPPCSTGVKKDTPRRIQLSRPVKTYGLSKSFVQGYRRPTSKDRQEDKAFLLLEAGFYLRDLFVLHDATRHVSKSVQNRARLLIDAVKK